MPFFTGERKLGVLSIQGWPERRDRRWLYSFLAAYIRELNFVGEKDTRNFPRGKGFLTRKSSFGAALKTFWTDGRFVVRLEGGGRKRSSVSRVSKRGRIDLDVYLSAAERRISDEHKLHALREWINWSSQSSNQRWFVMFHDVFSIFPFPLSNFPPSGIRGVSVSRVSTVSVHNLESSPLSPPSFQLFQRRPNALWRILFLNLTYLPG